MEEAFENTAAALYSLMVKIETVQPKEKTTITVSAPDKELLLVEWLNALLSVSDLERRVFSAFQVTMQDMSLTGTAWGERLDPERHEAKVEVKGATYHLLSVIEKSGKYTAQCVVDV